MSLACAAQAQQPQLTPFTDWMTYVGQQSGYAVTQGSATAFSPPGTASPCTPYISTFGSCFGNNPLTPYLLTQPPVGSAMLPPWASTFATTLGTGTPVNEFYKLSMNEAIVTVFTLPPVGAYWSFQSYLIERNAQYYSTVPTNCPSPFTDSVGKHVSTPDCGYDVFGLFNNTINNAVVGQYGPGFSDKLLQNPAAIAIITTPNPTLKKAILQYYSTPQQGQPAFGSASQIFPEAMPSSGQAALKISTPITSTSDVFGSVIRYNIPEVQTAGNQWLNNPSTYINVYRVYSSAIPTAYGTPTLTTQSYNTDECILSGNTCTSGYQSDVNELSALLISYLNGVAPKDTYVAVPASSNSYNSYTCIIKGKYCQGGTEDNDSYREYNIGQLPSVSVNGSQVYAIMVGVLHSSSAGDQAMPPATINNALYTGVSWSDESPDQYNYGIAENEGVGGVDQSNVTATGFASKTVLTGSALQILQATGELSSASKQLRGDINNLYAVVLTRSNPTCQIALCSTSYSFLNVLQNQPPPAGIPVTDIVSLTERGYLLPAVTNPTQPLDYLTGASATYLLNPNVICDQSVNACLSPQ